MNDQTEHWAKSAQLGALASVIDPNDTKGLKNLYIAQLRDEVLIRTLPPGGFLLLDFGCGSGNISKRLTSANRKITGIDISPELLKLAIEQNDPSLCEFVLYDGGEIPLNDESFDFVVTYVVLNHIVDDDHLIETLRNINKTLKEGGKALFIEQTRKTTTLEYDGIKKQRSVADFVGIFENAGFTVEQVEHVRKARFLPIYLIRYGLLPKRLFTFLSKIDGFFAKIFSAPSFSYVDTLFILTKNDVASR